MAHLKFKAFMSCSFAEEDLQIVEFFRSYCDSFGLEVLKYDFQEPLPLSDGVKKQIESADCLVAIATRRNRLESGEWVCSDWIQHEVVYASAVGKSIVVLAEEGVRIGGLVERAERCQPF